MVRCGQNRAEMKYESDCVNARDAINRMERAEEQARRERLEAQSERKRQQLRATQEAAAAARRRADEERRRQEEDEYLGLFEDTSSGDVTTNPQGSAAVAPPANAPTASVEPVAEDIPSVADETSTTEPATDLSSIREELKRRQEEPE